MYAKPYQYQYQRRIGKAAHPVKKIKQTQTGNKHNGMCNEKGNDRGGDPKN